MHFSSLNQTTQHSMAAISSSFIFFRSPSLGLQITNTQLTQNPLPIRAKPLKRRSKRASLAVVNAGSDNVRKEQVVIVGAGIAGLSTAVSLHRLGIPSLVLEQAESLRTGGTSLTMFKNGWKVLDAIGVADELRSQYLEIQGVVLKSNNGRELRSFTFKEADQTQEVRAVERRTLLETLAKQLPLDSISFSSKLSKIEKQNDGETLLELVNGTRISSKVVIGCDGIRSPVAKWMGFTEPKYVGYSAFRGLGDYPDGHPYEPRVSYVYGRGIRAGYVPVSRTKVYWFICFNSPVPGPKIIDPSVLKKQTKELIKNWPGEMQNIIDATPDDTIIRTPIVDRWLWPGLTPPAFSGGAVLVGDAWHPMTPDIGQGACCALEDDVVLVQKLAPALKVNAGQTVIQDALMSYQNERWPRIFPLMVRSNVVGAVLQLENRVVCAVRDNVLIPKLVKLGPMLEHTNFECEPIPDTRV